MEQGHSTIDDKILNIFIEMKSDRWKYLARLAGHTREPRASFVTMDAWIHPHHARDSLSSLDSYYNSKSQQIDGWMVQIS